MGFAPGACLYSIAGASSKVSTGGSGASSITRICFHLPPLLELDLFSSLQMH